jgi:hypothetical protein
MTSLFRTMPHIKNNTSWHKICYRTFLKEWRQKYVPYHLTSLNKTWSATNLRMKGLFTVFKAMPNVKNFPSWR